MGEPFRPLPVPRPDRGRETETRVLHTPEPIRIVRNREDRHDGGKALFLHHQGVVGYVDDQGRLEETFGMPPGPTTAQQDPTAASAGIIDLLLEVGNRFGHRQRAHGRSGVEGIPESIVLENRAGALDEFVVDGAMDVDPLHAAAGLPGVVTGTIDDAFDRDVEVRVFGYIGRILAAEFEADVEKTLCGTAVDGSSAGYRAREGDVSDPGVVDDAVGRLAGDVHRDQQIGHLEIPEGPGKCLTGERRAGTMLERDDVASEQGRDDHVDRNQERVVPGRDVQDHTQRDVLDATMESVFHRHRLGSQRLGRVLQSPDRAIAHGLDLPKRLRDRLPHLKGDVPCDLLAGRHEAFEPLSNDPATLGDVQLPPGREGGASRFELAVDRVFTIECNGPDHASVVGALDLQEGAHRCPITPE